MKSFKFILFVLCLFVSTYTIKAHDYQRINDEQDPTQLFEVVKNKLKQPEYAYETLPNDFGYLNQLLSYGHETREPQLHIRSVFSIFSKLLGGAHYVNAYAFSEMLDDLPRLLQPYFVPYKNHAALQKKINLDGDMYDRFKEAVNNMLYMQFGSQYEFFKNNPYQFFDELSQQIVDIAQEEGNIERSRYALMHFLEIGISKLVWSPEEQDKIWVNVKKISHQLESLIEHNILEDPNDLDDLFWALVHRFNYFLDVTSASLSTSFYNEVKTDVAEKQLLMLELDEQDMCIQTKANCLSHMLFQAEAKSRAYEKGILVS